VDMTFFTSPQEMTEMEDKINTAVLYAIEYVTKRSNEPLQ
jgi:hypothetical protein